MKRFVYVVLTSLLFFTEIFSACAVAVDIDTARLTRAQVFAAMLAAQEQHAQLIYEQRCKQLKHVAAYEAMEGFQFSQKSVADLCFVQAGNPISAEDIRKELLVSLKSADPDEEIFEVADERDYAFEIAMLEVREFCAISAENPEHSYYVKLSAARYKRKMMLRRHVTDFVDQLFPYMQHFMLVSLEPRKDLSNKRLIKIAKLQKQTNHSI